MGKRIVISTFGSDGNVVPYLLLAKELQQRGHRVVVATSSFFEKKALAMDLEFASVRPAVEDFFQRFCKEVTDERHGSDFILRQFIFPHLQETYDDLFRICEGADAIITQNLSFAGPLVAEKRGLPWISSFVAPMTFCSAYAPPYWLKRTWLSRFEFLGPAYVRLLLALVKRKTRSWVAPVAELRSRLGLPPGEHPLFGGQHAPRLMLGLFSESVVPREPDWPAHLHATGFVMPDVTPEQTSLSAECAAFLDAGEAPFVFTLGSAVSISPANFYAVGLEVMQSLGYRCILVCPAEYHGELAPVIAASNAPHRVLLCAFAPFAPLFARCRAVVHAGGIGTAALALKARLPSLIVPHSHDQPDNAHRLAKRGLALVLARQDYQGVHLRKKVLELIKKESEMRLNIQAVSEVISQENGQQRAADLVEEVLGTKGPGRARNSVTLGTEIALASAALPLMDVRKKA